MVQLPRHHSSRITNNNGDAVEAEGQLFAAIDDIGDVVGVSPMQIAVIFCRPLNESAAASDQFMHEWTV